MNHVETNLPALTAHPCLLRPVAKLHPPHEHFQGPEVFAGRVLAYPSQLPWEFTSSLPIRSVFPLWPIYEVPMSLLKWFYSEIGSGSPPPQLVYYALRAGMFLLSFVLEDWAIYELVPSPRHRRATVVLVASSYVTWTYQTHTFSNSLETLLVAWGLVLIRRIVENKQRSSYFSYAVFSFIAVVGVFNRITFPAFLLFPGLQLLPYFQRKPASLAAIIGFGLLFSLTAIYIDTSFYRPTASILSIIRDPIITPLNNILYNTDKSNLAIHGLHPHHQHFLANLTQLLGPAYIVMILSLFSRPIVPFAMRNARALSAVSATFILSIFPHQEPRFLLPCVPLLLSCVRMHRNRLFPRNMDYLQRSHGLSNGCLPPRRNRSGPGIKSAPDATVFWWKTYSPPLWLLGAEEEEIHANADASSYASADTALNKTISISTFDLMGIPGSEMITRLDSSVPSCGSSSPVYLVAPISATFLDSYIPDSTETERAANLQLYRLWSYRQHLNLDDMDFGEDGVKDTLARIVGRRGLGVWSVRRRCK
ncbi:GPI mannosyltransferase 4 [Penicillium cosmopolitanum]|uniref:Mannosyltransferase n=1 Tax=Penicillium cosmopolitanum TaxID=1131564 RepID=A0A9W9WBL8_9EURO|nr:GPI mannosyltransferase 4 [Penicillium cosmopolitanum]KAJ5414534.1 GPI mannosyltransferase 4 [Penicillium cosmopolitanum]